MFLPRLALTLHIEMETALYLIPVMLSDEPLDKVLPAYNLQIVKEIKYFIVENVRSARRFLKKCDRTIDIDSLTFYTLDEHTRPEEIGDYLNPLIEGNAMGVISEAGCPAIADPGADVVAMAQRRGLKVVPLVGPSSILLSLMASGFNGQSFAFQVCGLRRDRRNRGNHHAPGARMGEGEIQLRQASRYFPDLSLT